MEKKAPLFHIVKRSDISRGKAIAIRAAAIVLSLLLVLGDILRLILPRCLCLNLSISQHFASRYAESQKTPYLHYKTHH